MIHMLLAVYLSVTAVPVITLERTACFGPCPIYKLTIYDDGSVLYEGKDFVRKKGKVEGRITKANVEKLVRDFQRLNYFNLDDEYVSEGKNCPEWWTDSSSAVTSLSWKGKKKTIRHYQGCRGTRLLEQLTTLENKIDQVVNSRRWIK